MNIKGKLNSPLGMKNLVYNINVLSPATIGPTYHELRVLNTGRGCLDSLLSTNHSRVSTPEFLTLITLFRGLIE